MNFNMSKCLEAFSLALNFAEMDYFKINLNHSRRVAYISLNIAKAMGLSEDDQKDLFALSLLHDSGFTLSGLKLKPEFKMFELVPDHCIEGEKVISYLPFLMSRKDVIKYHHENYNGSGFFGISGDGIPLFSQVIHLADFLDINFNLAQLDFQKRVEAKHYVVRGKTNSFRLMLLMHLCLLLIRKGFGQIYCFTI